MDQPLADASCIALYFVSKIASEYVKVVLSGEGADELFGGYNIYHEPDDLAGYKKLPLFLRKAFAVSYTHLDVYKRQIEYHAEHGKAAQLVHQMNALRCTLRLFHIRRSFVKMGNGRTSFRRECLL